MDKQPVVFRLPGMDRISVRTDIPYASPDDSNLLMDVYTPDRAEPHDRHPAVLFIHGEVSPELVPHIKNWGQYTCWGRLAAVSGLVGITFNHRSTERFTTFSAAVEDIDALIAFVWNNAEDLGIDVNRLAIWTCSAGAYLGVHAALRERQNNFRCVVSYYGIMDIAQYLEEEEPPAAGSVAPDLSPIHCLNDQHGTVPPMLLVRAGRDRPPLNATIDRFINKALGRNLDIECINYPEGRHAFDVQDDTDASRRIIQRTLDFLCHHLHTT